MGHSSSRYPVRSLFFLLFLAFFISTGCQQKGETPSGKKGETIPILNPSKFDKMVTAHRGHVLIVNFFATWCEPCRDELPELISLANAYKAKGVDVIGISLDKGGEKVLQPFLKKIKIPYPVYLGNQALMDRLKIQAIPTTYIYDKEGKRVETAQGALTQKALTQKIEALLKAP